MVSVIKSSVMITSFVFTMMLLIEYLNVLTRGRWQKYITGNRWALYLISAFLGATPGCLGAFAVVTLYSHNIITVGALVSTMIATSGDESFVMFAMFPVKALLITGALFIIGVVGGFITDFIWDRIKGPQVLRMRGFEVHSDDMCICFPLNNLGAQWKNCSPSRGILTVSLIAIITGIVLGHIGDPEWSWIRITMLFVSLVALFVVTTVPDHFIEEHLWKHVVLKHVPRIFLWTFGVLLFLFLITKYFHIDLDSIVKESKWFVLVAAALVGLIPESGPHLIFVTLYARGVIPLSIMLSSSIVQDGHGMLPLIAHSRRSFFVVKGINFIIGILVGVVLMGFGY